MEVKLHPGWAYTKVQGDETAERKNDLERKKTLDELRDSAQVQLVKFFSRMLRSMSHMVEDMVLLVRMVGVNLHC